VAAPPVSLRSVVVTGAGGFVGQETCAALLRAGHSVRALTRRPFAVPDLREAQFTLALVEDLATAERLEQLLAGADAVVHLAARVHRVAEKASSAAGAYQRDVHIAKVLAAAARRVGVQRLVFLSSIKALGERSPPHEPLARTSTPHPADPYGRSKLAIERQLAAFAAATGLGVVVIRAPLVYGPGAGANFRQLVRWVRRGTPLPLAGVHNRRSIVGIDNLANCIVRCLGPLGDSFSTFHVGDAAPVSTPQLLRYVAEGLDVPARLFTVPRSLLEALCGLVGREDLATKLLSSLEFETADSFAQLAWRPGTDTKEGIARAIRAMKF
jgi:nucleoside-diphosphate-sugar epimerase